MNIETFRKAKDMYTFHNPNDYWQHRGDNEEPDSEHYHLAVGCLSFFSALIIFAFALFIAGIISMLSSCTTPKTIERTVTKHDTCYIQKEMRDSVYLHDSIYVKEWSKGDTLRIETERWHTRWRERIVRDTAYVSRTDTIVKQVNVPTKKDITGWQWAQIYFGRISMLLMILTTGVVLLKRKVFR